MVAAGQGRSAGRRARSLRRVAVPALLLGGVAALGAAMAQTMPPSTNIYGVVGGIEMPGGDHQPAGQLTTTLSHFPTTTRATLTFQITDRLSGSFRYASIAGYNATGRPTRYDRSFDLRFRLLDETRWRPAVTIGLQDFAGTGVYSGEYVVATKNLTPRLKVTAGLGWGRLGGAAYGNRTINIGRGGVPDAGNWFRGGVRPFGGIEWKTPLEGLTFKAEYSSDHYVIETRQGIYDRRTPLNLGLEWSRSAAVKWGLYYLNGDKLALNVSLSFNAGRSPAASGLEGAPLPVALRRPRLQPGQSYDASWAATPGAGAAARRALAQALETMQLGMEGLALGPREATLYLRNPTYTAQAEAVGRAARAMSRSLPASVETFRIVLVEEGLPTAEARLARTDLEELEYDAYGAEKLRARTALASAAPRPPEGFVRAEGRYPRLDWAITPAVRSSFFDPDEPIRAELGLRARASWHLAPGLSFTGSVIKPLVGNLDDITRGAGATPKVPRVRSYAAQYFREGDPALERLTADWLFKPHRDLYGRVSVGYLETMYGGVSAELLWKPATSRLALGAELNYARQREFEQRLGFRDYDIVTGHLSAYYAFDSGFLAQVDAGRYLAGDWGATFTLTRVFDNGWKVGAFFTLTDMPFEDFGEGSFDKGIHLEIPLHWGLGKPSRRKLRTTIRPLTRDGGARLYVANRLYGIVSEADARSIERTFGRVWR